MPFRYKVLIDSLKPIPIYFNKTNFEDQMSTIYAFLLY